MKNFKARPIEHFSDICDALKLCRDPTSPVEIELLLLLLKLKFQMTNQPTKDPFWGATKNACVFLPPNGGV